MDPLLAGCAIVATALAIIVLLPPRSGPPFVMA